MRGRLKTLTSAANHTDSSSIYFCFQRSSDDIKKDLVLERSTNDHSMNIYEVTCYYESFGLPYSTLVIAIVLRVSSRDSCPCGQRRHRKKRCRCKQGNRPTALSHKCSGSFTGLAAFGLTCTAA